MKILFLIRALNYGGAERQLVALACGLRERGHSVTVAVFYAGGLLERELREAGVKVYSLDKKSRWDALGFLVRLVKLARLERPGVAHGYLIFPNILTLLVKLLAPGTRAVWGVRDSKMAADRFDWLERILYRTQRWLSRFADLVIINSNAGFNDAIASGFPESKIIVIPNGIDTERFKPDREAGRRVRVELGVKDDETIIGIVGRLDPMKDHPTFLRAAALLAKEHDNLRFVCVGDGAASYRSELVQLSERLDLGERICWAGSCAHMPGTYNALDVIVSSSCYGEGFSNVIGEAMACGVMPVVTDVGDSALIVGSVGEVVPKKNFEQLKAAIERALEKLRDSVGDKISSRQRIVEHFSVSALINNTETALAQLHEQPHAVLCE